VTANGNPLVRCAWCDGASAAVRRVADPRPCAACREKANYRAVCPDCGGAVYLDPQAGAAFCSGCEFTIDLTHT
jgi:hypothetical protein